ncbi:MAG TPA: hypothetical protein DCM87_10455 [Planctomycetes bacterium]|nr:hypothetical protein [Planctomycetota bacterium]
MMRHRAGCLRSVFFGVLSLSVSCAKKPDTGADLQVTSLGSVEVTAELLEIPGEIRNDPMYDYAHVMQYRVLAVHRGQVGKDVIYVGQYNPAKPRDAAADARAGRIGGNLRQFRAGDVHRMAMEVPIDDHYMGGIINRYFGQTEEPVYWALWTNRAAR